MGNQPCGSLLLLISLLMWMAGAASTAGQPSFQPSPPPPPPPYASPPQYSPPPPSAARLAVPPSTAPSPAPASDQTAVIASLQLTGMSLLPFAANQQTQLQLALFDTVNNLVGAKLSILNLTQVASGRRHLLQPGQSLKTTLQIETPSSLRASDIFQQLPNLVNTGQLQAAAEKRGLDVSSLGLLSIQRSRPASANCPGASNGFCPGMSVPRNAAHRRLLAGNPPPAIQPPPAPVTLLRPPPLAAFQPPPQIAQSLSPNPLPIQNSPSKSSLPPPGPSNSQFSLPPPSPLIFQSPKLPRPPTSPMLQQNLVSSQLQGSPVPMPSRPLGPPPPSPAILNAATVWSSSPPPLASPPPAFPVQPLQLRLAPPSQPVQSPLSIPTQSQAFQPPMFPPSLPPSSPPPSGSISQDEQSSPPGEAPLQSLPAASAPPPTVEAPQPSQDPAGTLQRSSSSPSYQPTAHGPRQSAAPSPSSPPSSSPPRRKPPPPISPSGLPPPSPNLRPSPQPNPSPGSRPGPFPAPIPGTSPRSIPSPSQDQAHGWLPPSMQTMPFASISPACQQLPVLDAEPGHCQHVVNGNSRGEAALDCWVSDHHADQRIGAGLSTAGAPSGSHGIGAAAIAGIAVGAALAVILALAILFWFSKKSRDATLRHLCCCCRLSSRRPKTAEDEFASTLGYRLSRHADEACQGGLMQTGSDISSTGGYEAIKPQWVRRLPSSDPVCLEKPSAAATPSKPLLEQNRESQHSSSMVLQWASISKAAKGSATLLSQPQQSAPMPQPTARMPASPSKTSSTRWHSGSPLLSKPTAKPTASSEASQSQQAKNNQAATFVSKLDTAHAERNIQALLDKQNARKERAAGVGVSSSQLTRLHAALHFLADNPVIADAYELQGGRFSGHAAVVAEGRELRVPGRHVTARFYVDTKNFVAEHCFYVLASDANYIPAILETFEAGEASAAGSTVRSQPCLILERGVPTLQQHLSDPGSSIVMAPGRHALAKQACNPRSIFIQLCESLDYLHGNGLVARGVSVESAAFYVNMGRWCFTDFASWARHGDQAPLDTPLRSTAPEMLAADAQCAAEQTQGQAFDADEQDMTTCFAANPAADMWALGLVAWHLFSGKPLFGHGLSDSRLVSILLGYHPLPFESDPSMWLDFEDAQAAHIVRSLLVRQPEDRASIKEVLECATNLDL